MSGTSKSTKEEKQIAVSKAVLELIEVDGLNGVTHSKVNRRSGVSRAWIYEYIGKDKNAFIEFAAETLASHFARIDLELPANKEQLSLRLNDAVNFVFDSVAKDPVLIKLYFRFRGAKNPLGQVIKKYEKKWLNNAIKSLIDILGLSVEQAALAAEFALTLRLGFAHRYATSENPQNSREQAEKIFEFVHGMMSKN